MNLAAGWGDQGICGPNRSAMVGVGAVSWVELYWLSRVPLFALLPRPFTVFGNFFAGFWRELTRDVVRPYRPELHYMRGPGPAWRAKHGLPPA